MTPGPVTLEAPVATGVPDEALVLAAREGDRAALSALMARHAPDIARLCRRLAGTALADDCAQDTAVLALLRLPRLRDPSAFAPWLRGIAIYVCRRARARLDPMERLPAALPDVVADDGFEAELAETLSAADLGRAVRAAVQTLPPGQRDAVGAFYLAGQSYAAAAGALGILEGALKTRLHKARAALRHHLRLSDGPRTLRLDDRLLALHESAHAVLHQACGGRVARIAIAPHAGGWLGYCLMAGGQHQLKTGHALQATMAGEAAVWRAKSSHVRLDSGDRANAARLARAATGGDDVEAALFIARALAEARQRLDDPATWLRVERLAAALIERRWLDGDEVRALTGA